MSDTFEKYKNDPAYASGYASTLRPGDTVSAETAHCIGVMRNFIGWLIIRQVSLLNEFESQNKPRTVVDYLGSQGEDEREMEWQNQEEG